MPSNVIFIWFDHLWSVMSMVKFTPFDLIKLVGRILAGASGFKEREEYIQVCIT